MRIFVLFIAVCIGVSVITAQNNKDQNGKAESVSSLPNTLEVFVNDDDGKPIADAMVYVNKTSSRLQSRQASTDENGKAIIGDLSPGLYSVSARVPAMTDLQLTAANSPRYYQPGETAYIRMVNGGVITGTVTDKNGDPVVGIFVRVVMRPDADSSPSSYSAGRQTDDRGIYRIYGLPSGKYLVLTGGVSSLPTPFYKDVPTYFPSSTRDSAKLVNVTAGQESGGVDIHYRNEHGAEIAGTVSGMVPRSVSISLRSTGDTFIVASTSMIAENGPAFAIEGVPDGNYTLTARGYDISSNSNKAVSSASMNVTVQGHDIGGLDLKLASLASISGRIVFPGTKCPGTATPQPDSLLLKLRAESQKDLTSTELSALQNGFEITAQGEFQSPGLTAGSYRFVSVLPSDNWYISSIVRPTPRQPARGNVAPSIVSSGSVAVGNGEKIGGVTISVGLDGGSLNGKLIRTDGSVIQSAMWVYLVPLEKERAIDPLHYAETRASNDGSFSFKNIGPGKYRLLYRTVNAAITDSGLVWDTKELGKLLHDAEMIGSTVEIKPCQTVNDYKLRL